MNKLVLELFDNGKNSNNNFIIISNENEEIRCSLYILKNQSRFFKSLSEFNKYKFITTDIKYSNYKKTKLNYNSKVIKLLINKMYNSNYVLKNLSTEDILDIIKLIDEILLYYNKYEIIQELEKLFEKLLTLENWLDILKKIYDNDIYKNLKYVIYSYFLNLKIYDNIFDKININSEIGKDLIQLFILKINYLSKKYTDKVILNKNIFK